MVRIINFSEQTSDDGKSFFTLDVQGGIEMIKSKSTGNFYATARKTSITTTFDEATCQALIGTELPGRVEKQDCDAYEYTIKETGEIIQLSHRYQYVPETPSGRNDMSESTIDDFVPSKTASEEHHPLLSS